MGRKHTANGYLPLLKQTGLPAGGGEENNNDNNEWMEQNGSEWARRETSDSSTWRRGACFRIIRLVEAGPPF